jgi:hypothetical protein
VTSLPAIFIGRACVFTRSEKGRKKQEERARNLSPQWSE